MVVHLLIDFLLLTLCVFVIGIYYRSKVQLYSPKFSQLENLYMFQEVNFQPTMRANGEEFSQMAKIFLNG
jgi:hypothetical protein